MKPIVHLSSNQPADRFYRGGAKIREFRGQAAEGDHVPEDWVGSATTLFGEEELGLSTLPDGGRLRDAVAASPEYWLGERHVAAYGADTMLLVKLLHAGQRLPVHLHPGGPFAAEHLGHSHGKAEAWYFLEGADVHLGFCRDVSADELESWVAGQKVEEMLAAMHVLHVQDGESVFVPPGMPHAIGEGAFIIEVQEPEDLSILLEWKDFAIDGTARGHLGLGFTRALAASDRRGWSAEQIEGLRVGAASGRQALAEGSEQYFRAQRVDVNERVTLAPGFGVLVVTNGSGSLQTRTGEHSTLDRGDTVLVAHAAGELTVEGNLSFVRCEPPEAHIVGAR